MSFYCGVGSRKTPPLIINLMERLAAHLVDDYTLRSGHAPGADQAFERGAGGRAEIFLPWPSFCSDVAILGKSFSEPTEAARELAQEVIPHWSRLTQGGKSLHARNCHQVLGYKLDDPVEFVLCWTEGGRMKGGTATAIRLAKKYGIRVYNLGRSSDLMAVSAWL